MTTDTIPPPRPAQSALPIALAMVFAAVLLGPRGFGPMATLLVSLGSAGVAMVVLMRERKLTVTGRWLRVMALPALSVGWLLVGTLLSSQPWISLVGIAGQHTGWLLWCSLLLWFGIALGSSRPADARRTISVIGGLGGVAGFAVVLDALFRTSSATYSAAPSGVFENSLSAGQFLLVGLGCAVGWLAMWPRIGAVSRLLAIAATAAASAGLLLSASRAALAGVVAGAIVLLAASALSRRVPPAGRRPQVFAAVLLVSSLLVIGLATAASVGAVGAAASEAWESVANDRDDIWASVVALPLSHPLTGRGPDQFSALSRWDLQADGQLDYQGTYDPHGIVHNALVSAGIPGLLLGAGVVYLILVGLLKLVFRGETRLSLLAPVAGLVGWAVSSAVAWTNPLAALFAVVVIGSLLGAGANKDDVSGVAIPTWAWSGVASIAVIAAVLLVPVASKEHAFHAADGPAEQARVAGESYAGWADPTYAVAYGTAGGTIDVGGALGMPDALAVPVESAQWDVNLAILGALATQHPESTGADERWHAFVSMMDAGRQADPHSAIWDTLSALEADRRGLEEEASTYAASAREREMPDGARAMLDERLPEGAGSTP